MRKLSVLNLPSMKCDSGCGDCCGPAPATETEYKKALFVAKAKGIIPKLQAKTCPFYQHGTCQIYEARPLACKIFGHTERMACSRGYNTNVPEYDVDKMIVKNGYPKRILHEVLVEMGIVKNLEEALTKSAE